MYSRIQTHFSTYFFALGFVGVALILSLPQTVHALAPCSTLSTPIMQISIPEYGVFSNSAGNPDADYTITVPSGTVLSATYSNLAFAADTYTVGDSWPVGQQSTHFTNPGNRTHTTSAIVSPASLGMFLDPNCTADPSPAEGGSVTVNVNIASNYALTVTKSGTGSGTVTAPVGTSDGINCGSTNCSESYVSGTVVAVTANASSGSTFTGWSGACSGTGSCSVTMSSAKAVTATFTTIPTPPSCSVNPPSAETNTVVTATASGGSSGAYTWDTGGGSACASGATCAPTYATIGTKTITVTRNGVQGTCSVLIENGNTAPTGTLTGTGSCTATGWADDVDTTAPRSVRIYSDGGLVSTVSAGAVGCTGSACTFSSNLTGLVTSGVAHTITGEVQGDNNVWYSFTNSMSMTCAAPPTGTVYCSGVSAGITGTNYTFTGSGGSTYTWGISPTTGLTPTGATGSGSSVTKSFSAIGTKTITFTSGASNGVCTVSIAASAPLGVQLSANGSANPITIAYGALPVLSWASGGATRCDSTGAVPDDTDWSASGNIGLSGTRTVSPLVRTNYSISCVNASAQTDTDSILVRITPECLPAGQSVLTGVSAPLTARGGDGTYAWTATGGAPATGSGSSYSVSYATPGTKTVSLVSDSLSTSCTVTVNALLTITKAGTGSGTVTAPVGATGGNGISCGTNCTEAYTGGTVVTLTATPVSGSMPVVWSGDADCSDGVVTMSSAKNCTATFNLNPALTCSLPTQDLGVNVNTTLTATGGSGAYTWSGGGSPATGSGSPFTTAYDSEGINIVSVTSAGQTAQCTIDVEGSITVTSTRATTWTITSAGPQIIRNIPTVGPIVYSDITGNRQYTIIPAPIQGYIASVSGPGSAQTIPATGGSITFNIVYTPDSSTASVSLFAEGVGDTIDVLVGLPVTLTWDTTNVEADSCEGSLGVGTWATNNPKADDNGTEESGPILSPDTVFTITCINADNGLEVTDSVVIQVHYAECFNGIDDDGDGLFDHNGGPKGQESELEDGCPQCVSLGSECPESCVGSGCDDNEYVEPVPQCRDGVDNETTPDGKIDFNGGPNGELADPGCGDSEDDDERNNVVTQCNDTFDNDGDSFIDFSADPGCTDQLDESELDDPDVEEI